MAGSILAIFNKADFYSEPIDIEMPWIGNGTVSALESTFTFNRNHSKTINIEINTVKSSTQFEEWLTAWYKPINHYLKASYAYKSKVTTHVSIRNITGKNIAKVQITHNRLI